MSEPRDCCNPQPSPRRKAACPQCGAKGKPVPTETPSHLLRPEARQRLGGMTFLFCETPTCPVAYFSEGTDDRFDKSDLVVRVGLKETDPPRLVCYCFGHTMEEIEAEVRRTGTSAVVEDVRRKIKEGLCECEIRNPKGSCCLGELLDVVRAARDGRGRHATNF